MANKLKPKVLWITLLSMLLLATGVVWSQDKTEESGRLGDFHDGSESHAVHHIGLYAEDGFQILPGLNDDKPFSTYATCISCHQIESYKTFVDGVEKEHKGIQDGWHFNPTVDPNSAGPVGEPWIYWDCATGTQLPLSDRAWPGTFTAKEAGLSDWWMTRIFGRHMPGGGRGVLDESAALNPDDDWAQSGNLQVNCLACHDAEPLHDQAQQALLLKKNAFKWAGAATSAFAHVEVSKPNVGAENFADLVPGIVYDESRFFAGNKVRMDLRADVPNARCQFCHSTTMAHGNNADWQEDVHLAAGMSCVDCHTNGLDHQITRGYETEAEVTGRVEASTVSCKGCHLGQDQDNQPTAGRFGAPYPAHKGIPAIHFDVLSCTACHSGPWPDKDQTVAVKTSRAHALGTRQINRAWDSLPHIQMPVFVPGSDDKIAPHKLIWPAYWGWQRGDEISPMPVLQIKAWAGRLLNMDREIAQVSWPEWSKQDVQDILAALQAHAESDAKAVYVSGGQVYRIDSEALVAEDHDAAKPYMWPTAHNVRPAAQSLGVRACQDCHDLEAGIMFGKVAVDGPLADPDATITMVSLQNIDPTLASLFSRTFVFRPLMKMVVFSVSALLAVVLLLYGLKALEQIACVTGSTMSVPFDVTGLLKKAATAVGALTILIMAVTGFAPGTIHGYGLMLHAACAPVFILCMAYLAVACAKANACRLAGLGLIRAISFWTLAFLTLPLALSIAVSMLPVFGTHMQHVLASVHIVTAWMFAGALVVYIISALGSRK
ncbi:MAG: hypothetical protein HQ515_08110 [Phycisphaeraceae bacterium]|nr:hypothetical protein [Phycisphaeraceae bacterium]